MATLRIFLKECCPCQGYSDSSRMFYPSPAYLIADSGNKHLECSICHKVYPKRIEAPHCPECGKPLTKYLFNDSTDFFHYCVTCFPIIKALYNRSNIPFQELKNLDDRGSNHDLYRDIRLLRNNPKLIQHFNLLITGLPGSGKTLHSIILSACLIRRGLFETYYMRVPTYLNSLKRLYAERTDDNRPENTKRTEALYAVKNKEILIMDNLNREFKTDFEKNTIYDIVEHRCGRKLPTIFVSPYRNLGDILPAETVSRIAGSSRHYDLGDTDWRITPWKNPPTALNNPNQT